MFKYKKIEQLALNVLSSLHFNFYKFYIFLGFYPTRFSPSLNALKDNSSNAFESGTNSAPQTWILSSNFQPYKLNILVTYLILSAPTSGFELA